MLTVLWLPVCLVVWDKHLYMPCCGGAGSGESPRVLEYGRLAWPLMGPPATHRLFDPEGTRRDVAENLAVFKPSRGDNRVGWTDAAFGRLFDVIWKVRWLAIAAVVAVAVVGSIGVSRLQQPSNRCVCGLQSLDSA